MGMLKKLREAVVGDLTSDDFPPAESSRRELDGLRKKQRDDRERGDRR